MQSSWNPWKKIATPLWKSVAVSFQLAAYQHKQTRFIFFKEEETKKNVCIKKSKQKEEKNCDRNLTSLWIFCCYRSNFSTKFWKFHKRIQTEHFKKILIVNLYTEYIKKSSYLLSPLLNLILKIPHVSHLQYCIYQKKIVYRKKI